VNKQAGTRVAGQGDAAASGLGVEERLDATSPAEAVDQALQHGLVGLAHQVAVLGGEPVEWAVAQADGAIGVVVGLVAVAGEDAAESVEEPDAAAGGRWVGGELFAEVAGDGS
jgi:hypothetical protein